jgi:hypothetical protein
VVVDQDTRATLSLGPVSVPCATGWLLATLTTDVRARRKFLWCAPDR